MSRRATSVVVTLAAVAVACAPALKPSVPAPSTPAAAAETTSPEIVFAGTRDTTATPVVSASTSTPPATVITSSQVIRQAVAVFGDSIAPPVMDSGAAEVDASATWDIDVHSFESQARVEHWVRLLAGPARERFGQQLQRGLRYEPMLRAKLRAGGIPEDMVYLALIESGFNPHAYSRAAAVGTWQFMTTTARETGLRVDWWIDERRDPVRSTDAAVRFLRELQQQFGSLYLAAAAYNGGPARVSRGLSRYADDFEGTTGDSLFFALAEKGALRPETRDYVPKLIAAAIVAKEPERYGIHLEPQPPFAYDSVRVAASMPLAALARAAQATVADLQDLNPHVLRGVTPPEGSMFLRVPVGHAMGFDHALSAIPASEKTAYTRIETKKGQTLGSIAERNGITARQLAWYNPNLPTTKKGMLRPGQIVRVPSRAVVAAAIEVPDPGIERYSRTKTATRTHRVKSGESLFLIARRYNTSVDALMKANRLKKRLIVPGQEIVVSARASVSSPKAVVKKKTPAVKPASWKKVVTSKPVAKKPVVRKNAPTKSASKKPVAKKSASKKPAARKSR